MSNETIGTLLDRVPAPLRAKVEGYAIGFARGKDTFADMFMDAFRYVASANENVPDTFTRDLYIATRSRAETIAHMAHKPLKEQSDKSRAAQLSKLANAYTLGEIAREHNAEIADALEVACEWTGTGYTKLVKCAVALKACFVGVDPASVTLDAMREAMTDALVTEPVTASEAVAKMEAAWDKLVHGTDKEPSEYQPAFAALLQAYPADYAETVARNLGAIKLVFEQAEKARETELALSRAK